MWYLVKVNGKRVYSGAIATDKLQRFVDEQIADATEWFIKNHPGKKIKAVTVTFSK